MVTTGILPISPFVIRVCVLQQPLLRVEHAGPLRDESVNWVRQDGHALELDPHTMNSDVPGYDALQHAESGLDISS